MSTFPTGTVTFLFTDIEGSTKLAQQYREAMSALLARHNEILNQAIESYNGFVFQVVGDSYAVSFHNANDALNAALQAQRALHNETWLPAPLKVRMGIHTGAAQLRIDNQENTYSGYATLALTQRIMSAGHGGQILLSQTTHDLTRDRLPENAQLIDMGERRLKDILRPEKIYQLNVPDLPNEFPSLKTLDTQLSNLPVHLTPFVGREREITAVLGLMRNPDIRLVTLTGAGGTGKTRLSIQVAANLLDEYEHGVWFVELASITNPELVLPTIASTLKVKESAGTSIEQTLHENLSKKNLLLVIDNFEQVVSAAPVIGKLLAAAPKVRVLTSSREVLHLRGEHDYPVPPLGLPESKRKQTAAVLAQYEAIALFVQHARAANSAFELNEENALIVAEICMKLDGLPLAIELAAARSRLLKPAVMLEKLKSRLDVLVSKARDLPQRQQTIRGAIDWSYELLDDSEKTRFARLGIFVGGWTVESAEAVCGEDVLSGLESLLDKSLIRQFEGTSGETRFTMLETIREYAFEKLEQGGELPAIQQAHADYMEQFLQKIINLLNGPEEVTGFAKLDDEHDNLRSAVEWALAHNQPLLILKTGKLYQYWNQRGKPREQLGWLERAIAMNASVSLSEQPWAMNCAGNLLYDLGEPQQARAYYESALALFRQIGDNKGAARCLGNLGNIAVSEKDFEKARQLYEQSLVGEETDTFGASLTLLNLGNLARIRGDWDESQEYYLHSLEICGKLGTEAGISYAKNFLGTLAVLQRKLDEGRAYFESTLKVSWVRANPFAQGCINGILGYIQLLLGNRRAAQTMLHEWIVMVAEYQRTQASTLFDSWPLLEGQARLELMDGRAERAAHLFGTAWTLREKDDYPLTKFERPDYEAAIAEARSAIGNAAFDEAFAKGQAMTLEQAIQFALEVT